MKPIDVTDDSFVEYSEESNKKDPKFKVGDYVRISKYKNIFAKGCAPNCPEEVFVNNKIKNKVPWTYVINDLNGEEIIGSFYENMRKNCKKLIRKNSEYRKYLRKKLISYISNRKVMIILLIVELIKKISYENE